MATIKKPSTTTQLRNALAENKELQAQLDKAIKSAEGNRDYYSKGKDKSDAELESLHSLLDVLPNTIARKTLPDPECTWKGVEHSLVTRLAAFLALRG